MVSQSELNPQDSIINKVSKYKIYIDLGSVLESENIDSESVSGYAGELANRATDKGPTDMFKQLMAESLQQ